MAKPQQRGYVDLDLEVGAGTNDGYPVAIVRSAVGEARGVMRLQFDADSMEGQLLQVQGVLRDAPQDRLRPPLPELGQVQSFGRGLFEALFTGDMRVRYEVARREAEAHGKRLRLKLRFQTPELAVLPWEYLFDPGLGEYISLSRNLSVVRYLELPAPTPPLTVHLPLRILAMLVSPSDLPALDVDGERARLEATVRPLVAAGVVELVWVQGQSWRDLQRTMRDGPWHVFHFIGHGGFSEGSEEGLIVLAGEDGKMALMSAAQLGRLLADQPSTLRLAILNACDGARGSKHDLYSSTAGTLIQRGIPAVVAMQYEITDVAAVEFGRSLYEALAAGFPVDAAVTEARIAISMAVPNSVERGTPTLYLRSRDGVLFRPARQVTAIRGPSGTDPPATQGVEGAARSSLAPTPPLPANNLPAQLTSFIGREVELADVRGQLGTARLVTLTGAGGSGKTRLALEAAAATLREYRDGAWFVDLAPLTDAETIAQTITTVLAIVELPGKPLEQALCAWLHDRQLLLLLDNCEHLVEGCTRLADRLLRQAPEVTILATSREPLRVTGEVLYHVPVLAAPDDGATLETIAASGAVQLFVARAADARTGFALDAENARDVAAVCRQLDGIPLALELAAARLRMLTVKELLTRLADRFRLLSAGSRASVPRQATLRATIDWSYGLLNEPGQSLLQRLSVFAGGWALTQAEAICSDELVDELDVMDLLAELVDKSLVVVETDRRDEGRYRLLQSIREYAAEKLAAAGDVDELRDRHLAWFLKFAEHAAPELRGRQQAAWLARLELEQNNVRAALETALATDSSAAYRACASLWRFWLAHGYLGEGRAWLERCLAVPAPDGAAASAEVLYGAGVLAAEQGEAVRARSYFERCLALNHVTSDKPRTAALLQALGNLAWASGDLAEARNQYEQSLALYRELGDKLRQASALNNLGTLASDAGDFDAAAARHYESLALREQVHDRNGVALSRLNLGEVALRRGDLTSAASLVTEALQVFLLLGSKQLATGAIGTLARLAAADRPERAARLFGAASAQREALSVPLGLSLSAPYAEALDRVRAVLGDELFDARYREGSGLSLEAAAEEALSVPQLAQAPLPARG